MGLFREITETLLERLLPGLVDGVNDISSFLFQNVMDTFHGYESQLSPNPSWGSVSGLLGLILGAVFLLVGIFAFTTVVRRVSGYIDLEFEPNAQWGAGLVLYVIFQFALAGQMNPISIAKRTNQDSAVVFGILGNELPNYTVDMTGFTWGLLDNVLLEFIAQVGVIAFTVSMVAWWYTDFVSWPDWVEFVIDTAPLWGPVGLYFYAVVEGIQVFPLNGRLAFLLQFTVLVGVMVLIAAFLIGLGWMLMVANPLDLTVNKPRKLWLVVDGAILTFLVALAADGFTGLLLWTFVMIAILRYRPGIDVPGSRQQAEEIPGGD